MGNLSRRRNQEKGVKVKKNEECEDDKKLENQRSKCVYAKLMNMYGGHLVANERQN